MRCIHWDEGRKEARKEREITGFFISSHKEWERWEGRDIFYGIHLFIIFFTRRKMIVVCCCGCGCGCGCGFCYCCVDTFMHAYFRFSFFFSSVFLAIYLCVYLSIYLQRVKGW
ncbi:hypothetical protein B0T21DRAFT_6799 [Apiosordaria backusii]|uniref:Uncharacterized protein n=1 Tax=Apiosordaria backusii TaxID=314023 RepID=A0AA40K6D2_9PEZI|nr:hypothetical protein B0T21DRAFT_6799 [Apiosordaria backusii]